VTAAGSNDATASGELIWARRPRQPRGPQPGLSREQIVAAAVAIADREGVESLSMRRVAAALGAGTMSLYRYVSSKDDLLDLILDEVIGEASLPAEPSGDWRADLRALALRGRENYRRHPWMLQLGASRPRLGPQALRQMELTLGALEHLGVDITTMAAMQNTMHSYVVGAVQTELAEEEARRRRGLTDEAWRASLAPYVRQVIDSGDFPLFRRLVLDGRDLDADARFERFLDVVLAGLATSVGGAS
jgi:AcrR family transcriptional regulator